MQSRTYPTLSLARSSSLSFSPGSGLPIKASSQKSPVASSGPVFVPPPSLQKQRRRSLHFVTPKTVKESSVPAMPVAIPALKIIKRPRVNGNERRDSAISSTRTTSNTEEKSTGVDPKEVVLPAAASLKARKPVKVQETPRRAAPERALQAPSRQPAKSRMIAPRSSLTSAQINGLGPRRVPVSEGPQIKSATTGAPRSATMPLSATGGPRRVPALSSSTALPPQTRLSLTATNVLKAPTHVGTSSTTSSLPKPTPRPSLTSRLPAPRGLKAGGLATVRRAT